MESALVCCPTIKDIEILYGDLPEQMRRRYSLGTLCGWYKSYGEETCVSVSFYEKRCCFCDRRWYEKYYQYLDDYRSPELEEIPIHRRFIGVEEFAGWNVSEDEIVTSNLEDIL